MPQPPGPIYASSLHRRDRAWRPRRRRGVARARVVALSAAGLALAAVLVQHLA